jgi:predicted porin
LTNHKVTTYGIEWAAGPLTAGYAYGESALNSSTNDPSIDNMYVGYKLGAFDFRLQQVKETTVTSARSFKTTEFSVKYALGGGVDIIGHYEQLNISDNNDSDYKQMGILINKELSKRTSVFAGFRDRDLSGPASGDTDVTITTVGVQHKF